MEHHNREGKSMYIPLMLRDRADEIEQQGIEKGIEKGIKEGIKKGKLKVARNMLANGISLDIIAKSAELPIEKIRRLMK
jgi:predicted transposase/invertase (TIGR01784 family)